MKKVYTAVLIGLMASFTLPVWSLAADGESQECNQNEVQTRERETIQEREMKQERQNQTTSAVSNLKFESILLAGNGEQNQNDRDLDGGGEPDQDQTQDQTQDQLQTRDC
ncbi:hypothetical protein [Desulfopila sp. IMCC35008]|uniref:hypothetical protein n=1 Tax=Desulfopila sp. IMCC35008 TaxID=2653858 RepID=UPI002714F346|nr:hypothetical protein [Desulfopila sp. IMCC35008]